MSEIKIKIFPASYGDSFLITCKGETNTHILVDMGFESTYDNYIKEELKKINKQKERISLLVFTHTDEDHILGGIKFISENGNDNECKIINIDEVWYNSYRHLQFDKRKELKAKEIEKLLTVLKGIVEKGHIVEKGYRTVNDISYSQGSTLASLLYKNEFMKKWNKSYSYEAVVQKMNIEDDKPILRKVDINNEVKIIVLSPNEEKLRNLDKKWEGSLRELGYNDKINNCELMDDALEIYMSSLDEEEYKRSVQPTAYSKDNIEKIVDMKFEKDSRIVNGSSIAFILEFYDKKLLFLGDSHTDIVEANLEKYMREKNLTKIKFDVVKISHHGSKHNTSMSLLNKIESDRFIISTNGRGRGNCHPDIESICRIIYSNNYKEKELIFNYKPNHIFDEINNKELMSTYKYSITYKNDSDDVRSCEITNILIPTKDKE